MSSIQIEQFPGLEARLIDPENLPWSAESEVLYAIENNQEVVGRLGAMPFLHIEGVWIREDKRGTNLLARLVAKLENLLANQGKTAALVFVKDDMPEMTDYVKRLGYLEMPLKVYCKALVEEKEV